MSWGVETEVVSATRQASRAPGRCGDCLSHDNDDKRLMTESAMLDQGLPRERHFCSRVRITLGTTAAPFILHYWQSRRPTPWQAGIATQQAVQALP